jgi:hypothetical protein
MLSVSHNHWYRGSLEGIATQELARLLPWHKKLSWRMITYVAVYAKLHASANDRGTRHADPAEGLSKTALFGILTQLRFWVETLQLADTGKSVSGDCARSNTCSGAAEETKRRFVAEFAAPTQPNLLWALGCNTGNYSAVALAAGARAVIGFDFDQEALETAFARACREELNLLLLFLDAANPSPDQSWSQAERRSLHSRRQADRLLALAFEHHLAVGRNVLLDQVVRWLVGLVPRGSSNSFPGTIQRSSAC